MHGVTRCFIIFVSTGCFSGFVPVAPGTVGTLLGIPLFFLFSSFFVPAVSLLFTVVFIFFSILVSHYAELLAEKKDPSHIVIDEIAGYLVTMATFPMQWEYVILGFFLFRILDIVKPFPADWINDNLTGGAGVVLDDVVAGLYANVILQVIRLATS
jgi:phosphatidylglycerophosphatase A